MKRTHLLFSAVAAMALGGSAFGQLSNSRMDVTPYNFSFRGGMVMPQTDPLHAIENIWMGIGVDYTFTKQFFKNSETYLSIDYITKSGSGQKGTYWPILVNQRIYSGAQNGEENRTYFIAGVGVVVFDVISSDTTLGGRIGAGMELSPQLFIEGSYFMSDAGNGGMRAQGVGLYLGYRF